MDQANVYFFWFETLQIGLGSWQIYPLFWFEIYMSPYLLWNRFFLFFCKFADSSIILRCTINLFHFLCDVSSGFDFADLSKDLKAKQLNIKLLTHGKETKNTQHRVINYGLQLFNLW